MTQQADRESHAPAELHTTLRKPQAFLYWIMAVSALFMIAQGIRALVHPLFRPWDVIFGCIALPSGLLALAIAIWALKVTRVITTRWDAAGISSSATPAWSVRWQDVRAVRLRPNGSWVQLAVLEWPAARDARQLPWWARSIGEPPKTLISSFPASDEPRVREILASHGIRPHEFPSET